MIAVLDYGIGNLRSAEKALQHLGVDAALTTDPALARELDLLLTTFVRDRRMKIAEGEYRPCYRLVA